MLALGDALALDLAHDLRAHLAQHLRVDARVCSPARSQIWSLSIFAGRSLATSCLGAAQDERVDRRAQALRPPS